MEHSPEYDGIHDEGNPSISDLLGFLAPESLDRLNPPNVSILEFLSPDARLELVSGIRRQMEEASGELAMAQRLVHYLAERLEVLTSVARLLPELAVEIERDEQDQGPLPVRDLVMRILDRSPQGRSVENITEEAQRMGWKTTSKIPSNTMRTTLNRLVKEGTIYRDDGLYIKTDYDLEPF